MRGGAKVVVEPHRHEGVFIARGKEDALVTKNMVVGESVYGEKRISVDVSGSREKQDSHWPTFCEDSRPSLCLKLVFDDHAIACSSLLLSNVFPRFQETGQRSLTSNITKRPKMFAQVHVCRSVLYIGCTTCFLVIIDTVQMEDGTKVEYRVWNPFRSKLAAAILGGVDNIWIVSKSTSMQTNRTVLSIDSDLWRAQCIVGECL